MPLPPSLPPDPPGREERSDASRLERPDQVAQLAIDGLKLKRPGSGYERRMAALVPVERAVVEHAIKTTLDGADVPNWEYFLQCLEKPRARSGPSPPREPRSPFEESTKAAMEWARREDAKDAARAVHQGNDASAGLLPAARR